MSYHAPIVSVVMPMYNVEKYIKKSMESVLNQTYSHFEVICVDDGCTDNTIDILSEFKDSRIKVISQKNAGLAAARNTGINHARGLYVALLDSDDFWAPQKLEKHVSHLNHNPDVGVSFSPSLFVDEEDQIMGIGQYPKLKNLSNKDIFCRNPVGNGSAAVIRRSILNGMANCMATNKGTRRTYFDENLRQSEDIEFWTRMALNRKWKFEGVKEPLTFYRVNSSGLSANLEKQLHFWQMAVEKNKRSHEVFFDKWGNLARAYQLRYLARRAIQSGNRIGALSLTSRALFTDFRILLEEPKRTINTCVCALLSLLPHKVYRSIENTAMQILAKRNMISS